MAGASSRIGVGAVPASFGRPPFVAAAARPVRPSHRTRAQAGPEQPSTSDPQSSRRDLLLLSGAALTLLLSPASGAAEGNAAVQAGLSKYVKRKRLDRVDSYLPPLLQARGQLTRLGRVMLQSPADARQLLRTGSFAGVRSTVRALGEFAAEAQGEEASRVLVTSFFRAIEALDATLAASSRSGAPLDAEAARAALADTAAAIDKLLATVPEGALSAAERVVRELGDDDEAAAVESAAEAERLRKLL